MARLRIPLLLTAAGATIVAGGYLSCRPGDRADHPQTHREQLLPFHTLLEGEAPTPHAGLDIVDETLTLGWGKKTATRRYFGGNAGAYVAEEYWYPDESGAVRGFDSLTARGRLLPASTRPTSAQSRRELFLRFGDHDDAVPAILLRSGRRLRIIHGLPLPALRDVEERIAPLAALLPDSLPSLLQRTLDDPRLRDAFDDHDPVLAADDRLRQILPRLRFRGHPLRTSAATGADITIAAITITGDYARLVLDLPSQRRRFTADYLRDRQSWKLTGKKLEDRRTKEERDGGV